MWKLEGFGPFENCRLLGLKEMFHLVMNLEIEGQWNRASTLDCWNSNSFRYCCRAWRSCMGGVRTVQKLFKAGTWSSLYYCRRPGTRGCWYRAKFSSGSGPPISVMCYCFPQEILIRKMVIVSYETFIHAKYTVESMYSVTSYNFVSNHVVHITKLIPIPLFQIFFVRFYWNYFTWANMPELMWFTPFSCKFLP